MARKRYILTQRATADLREARAWSRARWGKKLTQQYFTDLHKGAGYIAENHANLGERYQLSGRATLHLYPVREHYLVYEPLGPQGIAVVAVIRQGRDIPAILQKWVGAIRRELADIRMRIERGEITFPAPRGTKRGRSNAVRRK